MNTITINGVTYSGNNITILNGQVIIDGKDVTPESKKIDISVQGNINELKVDSCNKLEIFGDVSNIKTQSADVEINGSVLGSVQTMSGDVDCGYVGGPISTMSGDVTYRKQIE